MHIGRCRSPARLWPRAQQPPAVAPLVKRKGQLAFVLLLYRRCCICKSATVTVPTHEFESLGISRQGKYRLLLALEQAGVIRVEATQRGQVGKVTLVNWPEPS